MPKPKNKTELLQLSQTNFSRLNTLIDTLSTAEQLQEFPIDTMNRNIRDVLAHLHQWHLLFLQWYTIGMTGEKPQIPAKGYTWKTVPTLNKAIWSNCQNTTLEEIREQLSSSYQDLQKIIGTHSDEELFQKKRYKWTGSTSLGAYLISNTSSHYDWAWKLIKKSIKKPAKSITHH